MKAATAMDWEVLHFTLFKSTPPVKAATAWRGKLITDNKISIHAAREGGDKVHASLNELIRISIHAAREGGDAAWFIDNRDRLYFNPRRP